ncbi:MAG: 5-oxoprolinase subunit PxpB [Gemmatimonadaceae bacterium]
MSQTFPYTQPLGDSAVSITFGSERTPELLERVQTAAVSLAAARIPGVQDIVPAYLRVAIFYDPLALSYREISATLLEHCKSVDTLRVPQPAPREHLITVAYDGPDLTHVADTTGLSVEEVIARHTGRTYTVDIIGFVPGFAYLSELEPGLHLPRRAEPRPRVPAGSVAIAGAQTAVYPLDTPGGWHLIGRTSTTMFDPARDPPALLQPGDKVRFEAER